MQLPGSAILVGIMAALIAGASIGTMYGITHNRQVGNALTEAREFGILDRTSSPTTAAAVASVPAILGGMAGAVTFPVAALLAARMRHPSRTNGRRGFGVFVGLLTSAAAGAVAGALITAFIPRLIAEGSALGAVTGAIAGLVSLACSGPLFEHMAEQHHPEPHPAPKEERAGPGVLVPWFYVLGDSALLMVWLGVVSMGLIGTIFHIVSETYPSDGPPGWVAYYRHNNLVVFPLMLLGIGLAGFLVSFTAARFGSKADGNQSNSEAAPHGTNTTGTQESCTSCGNERVTPEESYCRYCGAAYG